MDIITKEEQNILLEWIYQNDSKFVPNQVSKNRKFISLNKLDSTEKLDLFSEIKLRILDKEQIREWIDDPFFGDLVTYNYDGGSIQKHTDPTLENREHIRFNLFLSKPESGGDPILIGERLNFEERQYNVYHVNKLMHWSLPVQGPKPRISISYGISVTTDYFKSLLGA